MNTNSVPSLSPHRYTDNYQNIYANLSLPSLSTHINVPTHVNVPSSQAIAFGQSNVTQPSALYASNLNSSSVVAFHPAVSLPIAVGQPGLSVFFAGRRTSKSAHRC